MEYCKIRNVKDPSRGTKLSAGIDFYIPILNEVYIENLFSVNKENKIELMIDIYGNRMILLPPHEQILIPSGIHVKLEPGTAMKAMNKSGVSSKLGLDVMAELVDEDYQGEVHLSVNNTSNNVVWLTSNMKLIQFVIIKVELCELIQRKDPGELYDGMKTERGDGAFGSTGN